MHYTAFQISLFMVLIIFAIMIIRGKTDLPQFIGAINSVGSQPTAITVMMIGCIMLVMCKIYGLDSTIAGGIIGVASNMLTNMFVKTHTDNAGNKSQDSEIPKV
jgi:hypothetical protein